jgi:hypothetical protein
MALPDISKFLKKEATVQLADKLEKQYMTIRKQWKDGEISGQALIQELQKDLNQLENDAKIFNGSEKIITATHILE